MIRDEIKVPIYNGKIIVVFTDDLQSAMHEYSDEDCDHDIAITVHFDTPLNYVMGFGVENLCHMVVSHEVCHVTHKIMYDVGIEHTSSNDETEAYLHAYIVNEVYKIIKTNNLMCYGNED